jgi:uncharacterized protein YbjT (DUF2867 family)
VAGPILVTGATGRLGRLVVARLRADGHRVRTMSRRPCPPGYTGDWVTADLRTGRGVDDAVAGAEAVVHCATLPARAEEARLAATLVRAAQRVGGPYLVYVSIVGVDRVPLGYYQGKLAAERLVERSHLPYAILRATQFHSLLDQLFGYAARLPVLPVPDFPVQPVDAGEVAARLAELVVGAPAGRVPDLGGPQVRGAGELARAYLAATGQRRPLWPIRLPGRVFGAYRAGGHLAPDHATGTITFEQYLAGRLSTGGQSR